MAGTWASYAGYFVGRVAGDRLSDALGRSDGTARRVIRHSTGYALGVLATAGAVYGIANIGEQTASFRWTLGGTGIGFATALGVNYALWPPARQNEPSSTGAARRAAAFIEVFLPAIGATIAANATRK